MRLQGKNISIYKLTSIPHHLPYKFKCGLQSQNIFQTCFEDAASQCGYITQDQIIYSSVSAALEGNTGGSGEEGQCCSCCCCCGSDERKRVLISCAACDRGLPCTVPQGYCRALTILFPILTSSVLPTTANGKWLCGKDVKKSLRSAKTKQQGHSMAYSYAANS